MEKQLMSRIRAVNLGHIKYAAIIYCQESKNGGLNVGLEVRGQKLSKVEQLHIGKPMMKALRTGGRNRSLDNLLRL